MRCTGIKASGAYRSVSTRAVFARRSAGKTAGGWVGGGSAYHSSVCSFCAAPFRTTGIGLVPGEGSSLRNPRSYRTRVRQAMQTAQQQETHFESQAMSANLYGSSGEEAYPEEGRGTSGGSRGRRTGRGSFSRLPKSKRQRASHHRVEHVGKEVFEKAKLLSDSEWESVPLEDKHAFTQYMSKMLREYPTQTSEQQRRRYFETTLVDPRDLPPADETVQDEYERIKLGLPVQMKQMKRGLGVPDAVYEMSDASMFDPAKSDELEAYMIQIKQLFADYVQHRREGKSTEAERRRLALMTRDFHEQTQQHLGNMFKYAEERIRKVAQEERMEQWKELEALKAFLLRKKKGLKKKGGDGMERKTSDGDEDSASNLRERKEGEGEATIPEPQWEEHHHALDGSERHDRGGGAYTDTNDSSKHHDELANNEGVRTEKTGIRREEEQGGAPEPDTETPMEEGSDEDALSQSRLYEEAMKKQYPKRKRHSSRVKHFVRQALGVDSDVARSIWQELDAQLKFMSFCEVFARLTLKKGFMHTERDETLDAYTERLKTLYSVDATQWSTLEVVQYMAAKEATMPVEWAKQWYERLLRIPLLQVPEYKRLEEMRKEEVEAMKIGKQVHPPTPTTASPPFPSKQHPTNEKDTDTHSLSNAQASQHGGTENTSAVANEPSVKVEEPKKETMVAPYTASPHQDKDTPSGRPTAEGLRNETATEGAEQASQANPRSTSHTASASSSSREKQEGGLPLFHTITDADREEAARREGVARALSSAAIEQQQGKVIRLVEKMFLKPEDPRWETLHEKRLRYLAYLQMEEQIRQARKNAQRYVGIENSEEAEQCRRLYRALLERGERYRHQQQGTQGEKDAERSERQEEGEEKETNPTAMDASSVTGTTWTRRSGTTTSSLPSLPDDLFAKDEEAVKIFEQIRDIVVSVMERHSQNMEGDASAEEHRSPAEKRKAKLEEAAQLLREKLEAGSSAQEWANTLDQKRNALAERLIDIAERDIKSELDWISAMEEAERPPLLPVPLEGEGMSYISVADVQAWREAREAQQAIRHSPFAPAQRRRAREVEAMQQRARTLHGADASTEDATGRPTRPTEENAATARRLGESFSASFLGQPWEIPNKPTLFWGTGVRAVQQALEQAAEEAAYRRQSKELLPPPYPCAVNPWGWRLVKDILDD